VNAIYDVNIQAIVGYTVVCHQTVRTGSAVDEEHFSNNIKLMQMRLSLLIQCVVADITTTLTIFKLCQQSHFLAAVVAACLVIYIFFNFLSKQCMKIS